MKKDSLQKLGRFGPHLPLLLLLGAFATEIVCRVLSRTEYAETLPLNSIRLLATLTSWTSILLVIITCSRLKGIVTLTGLSVVFIVIGEIMNFSEDLPVLGKFEAFEEGNLGQFAARTFFQLSGFALMFGSFYIALFELRKSRDETLTDRERLTQEIGERKKAEEALAERERLYRGAIEVAGAVAYYQVYETNEYPFIGGGIEKLIGCKPEEFGDKWDSMIRETVFFGELEGLEFDEAVTRCRSEGLIWRADHRVRLPSGEEKWISNAAVQVRDQSGRIIGSLGILQDLSERKKAEEERKTLEDQVRHAQKLESLGVLAGGIAHDFNNLLVGVMGNAGLAQMDLPEGSNARALIGQIEVAALRAADLTRQMLAYSGKGQLAISAVHLNSLVEEIAGLLKASIGKNVRLEFDFDPDLPLIEADPTQLRQVVMNLITNGSEAIGDAPGIVVLETRKIRADSSYLSGAYLDDELPEGDYISLSVTDTGSGMDPETAGKIFDPFFTTKFTGRGLGLAAVLGIIRGHRGAIKVTSRLGTGTTVQTLFPISKQALALSKAAEEKGPVWDARGEGLILVVDDEPVVRDLAVKLLVRAGFETVTASNGRDGVDLFSERADGIRLVLLDRMMPILGGDEALCEIKRIRPEIPVILSSGYDETGAPQVDRNGSGPSAFIQKPYQSEVLIRTVYNLLGL